MENLPHNHTSRHAFVRVEIFTIPSTCASFAMFVRYKVGHDCDTRSDIITY